MPENIPLPDNQEQAFSNILMPNSLRKRKLSQVLNKLTEAQLIQEELSSQNYRTIDI